MRRFSLVILALFSAAALAGCLYYPELILRGEPSRLNAALAALTASPSVAVPMQFQVEGGSQEGLASGESSPPDRGGPGFQLSYPATEMILRAGEAAVARWTVMQRKSGQPVILTAKLVRLYYHSVSNYFNRAQALVAVTVHVRATYGSKVMLDTAYESGDQYSEPFPIGIRLGVGERYEQHFSQTVYKALLIALKKAMADIGTLDVSGND